MNRISVFSNELEKSKLSQFVASAYSKNPILSITYMTIKTLNLPVSFGFCARSIEYK